MAFLAKLFGKKKDNAPDEKTLVEEEGLTPDEEAAAEAAEALCEAIGCESVQVIGGKFVLFLQKKKDSKYDLKNLCLL